MSLHIQCNNLYMMGTKDTSEEHIKQIFLNA